MRKYLSMRDYLLATFIMPPIGFLLNVVTLLFFQDELKFYFKDYGKYVLIKRLESELDCGMFDHRFPLTEIPFQTRWTNHLEIYMFHDEKTISIKDKQTGKCVVSGEASCKHVANIFENLYFNFYTRWQK